MIDSPKISYTLNIINVILYCLFCIWKVVKIFVDMEQLQIKAMYDQRSNDGLQSQQSASAFGAPVSEV